MKKLLFITNIPAPYRIDFFNALGKSYDLTVIFEARRAQGIRFNWNEDSIKNFRAIFLSDGIINEKRIDFQIFKLLKAERYDHIVATSYGYYTEMAALFYMIARKIPYYLELDGGVVRPGENPVKRAIKRRLIRSAKGLFSSSRRTDDVLLHYGAAKEKIFRYPFTSLTAEDILAAPPTPDEKAAAKATIGISERAMILGVGQFIHRKGFDILLRAARSLEKDIAICLAGAEPTEELLALSKNLPNVHFVGFLNKEQLARYFCAADVFALPTREDMWGLVVNEALANAVPVITTLGCVAGTELITDGEDGYLIPVEDEKALSDCINRLLSDEALRLRMAENALDRIRPYTIAGMVQAHERVFNGLEA